MLPANRDIARYFARLTALQPGNKLTLGETGCLIFLLSFFLTGIP
jgi:hypothetical protein